MPRRSPFLSYCSNGAASHQLGCEDYTLRAERWLQTSLNELDTKRYILFIMFIRISVIAIAALLLALDSAGQQIKVKEDRGHISPVNARLTFRNDKTRDVVISAIGGHGFLDDFLTHVIVVRTEGGASKRTLWIDQLKAIRGLSERPRDEFIIELKDGTAIDATFGENSGGEQCKSGQELQNADRACSLLIITNTDESTEQINMMSLKSVEFLPPARRDKAGNFMFDTWRYSPFTGEKLGPVGAEGPSAPKSGLK